MDHRSEHARKRANQGGGDAPHAMMGRCAPSVKEASTLRSCFYFLFWFEWIEYDREERRLEWSDD